MTFDEAKHAIKPFGKFVGWEIDIIGHSDEGLRHLDWLVGWFHAKPLLYPHFQDALRTYLADPAIKAEVERIVR